MLVKLLDSFWHTYCTNRILIKEMLEEKFCKKKLFLEIFYKKNITVSQIRLRKLVSKKIKQFLA